MEVYKEIMFEDDVIDVINRLAVAGINIKTVNISSTERRIVVTNDDLQKTLENIYGAVCISNVYIYNIQETPGSLYRALSQISDENVVAGIYSIEGNKIAVRYDGLCDF